MEADNDAAVLMRIIELVQDDQARDSRKRIFTESDKSKLLNEKYEKDVEDVCWRYDASECWRTRSAFVIR